MTPEQRYLFLNRAGIVIGALFLIVIGIDAALAIQRGQIIVGYNYWNAPLFAMTQLIVVLFCTPFFVHYAVRHWNDDRRRRPKKD